MTPQIPPLKLTESEWRGLAIAERALMLAAQFCDVDHVREDPIGSNRGSWVDAFLTYARAEPGQPWCAAFVAFCIGQAGKPVYSPTYGDGVRYPASVASWFDWARASGRWSRTPRRGRLFVISTNGESHMGFVTQANADGTFATIEGNSDENGSLEGYEVCRHTRPVAKTSGFIDFAK
jgi:CHAP domain-containing protein